MRMIRFFFLCYTLGAELANPKCQAYHQVRSGRDLERFLSFVVNKKLFDLIYSTVTVAEIYIYDNGTEARSHNLNVVVSCFFSPCF